LLNCCLTNRVERFLDSEISNVSTSSFDRSSQTEASKRSSSEVGILAEALVAQWLLEQGWEILQRRWRCRFGELDLVARSTEKSVIRASDKAAHSLKPQTLLSFVEVKARSRGSWDADGLLAITPQKQAKLRQAAQLFLTAYPDLAELPCRFDVALVSCWRSRSSAPISHKESPAWPLLPSVQLGKPVSIAAYQLSLQHYLQDAFD
jgi:putative endonuclease